MRQAIFAPDAPKAMGAYSPAVRAGNLLFISGQIPINPATGELVSGSITAEAEQVMRNLSALLKAAGLGFDPRMAYFAYSGWDRPLRGPIAQPIVGSEDAPLEPKLRRFLVGRRGGA